MQHRTQNLLRRTGAVASGVLALALTIGGCQLPESISQITNSSEQGAEQAAESFTTEQLRSAAYVQVIEDLEARWGKAELAEGDEPESDGNYKIAWAQGVCFVNTLDFGDGEPRLIVGYLVDPALGQDSYMVEVWHYDQETQRAQLNFAQAPHTTDTAHSTIVYYQNAEGVSYLFDEVPSYDTFASVWRGVTEDGSFGDVLTTSTSTSLTYFVNGEQVEADTYKQAQDDLATVSNSLILVAGGNTTEAAKEAASQELTTSEYNNTTITTRYPVSIIEATQQKIEQLKQEAGEAPAPEAQVAPTVTVVPQTEELTLPTYPNGPYNEAESTTATWTTVTLESDEPSAVVDKINNLLKAEYEEHRDASVNYGTDTIPGGSDETLEYDTEVTYNKDGYLGVQTKITSTLWGTHPSHLFNFRLYDLKTGVEVEPWQVLNVTPSQLKKSAEAAVESYIRQNSDGLSRPLDESIATLGGALNTGAIDIILTESGPAAYLNEYSLYVYAAWHHDPIPFTVSEK